MWFMKSFRAFLQFQFIIIVHDKPGLFFRTGVWVNFFMSTATSEAKLFSTYVILLGFYDFNFIFLVSVTFDRLLSLEIFIRVLYLI